MASVELVLAAVSAADLCLKYGTRLIRAYQAARNAHETIKAKVLVVEAIWSRTAIQVEFVRRIANKLEPEHCRVHAQVFGILLAKLSAAVTKIESVITPDSGSGVSKIKFLFYRGEIDGVISELEQWQRLFDPTWYLILRMEDQAVDAELSRPPSSLSDASTLVFANGPGSSSPGLTPARKLRGAILEKPQADVPISLREDGLDWENAVQVSYSTARVISRVGSDSKKRKTYVVDTINCTSDLDIAKTRADATTLAKKLAQADSASFGLLSCNGLVKRKNPETQELSSLNLVFHMPHKTGIQPTTLRQHLLHSTNISLTKILNIVRQLAGAVSFVHTCDFVHKNIRPETILIFPDADNAVSPPNTLGSAYLVGFDSFRSVNFHTLKTGDIAWDRNMYRHPSRQGIFAQDTYNMQHDVYTLGVCLLELGLWESFVRYEDGKAVPSGVLGLGLDDFAFLENASKSDMLSSGCTIKDHLVSMARERLPRRMGDRYTAVVVTCLTCLDKDNGDFGNEEDIRDDDGILIGVRFIEKVLLKLGDITL